MLEKKIERHFCLLISVLVLINILVWISVYDLSQPQYLEVSFFDVGQGDSIFIETPLGHQILIDGGPDSTVLEKLANEMPFWDKEIDLVILTHPEHDHISGLIDVLESFEVKNILWTGVKRNNYEYNEWKKRVREENSNVVIAQSDQCIRSGDVFLFVLWPDENLENKEVKNINNSSIVMRLVFGRVSFLFEGDAFKSVEKKLIEKNKELKSNVLKVAHHGSKTSTGEEFLKEVFPEVAVIEVGKNNRYGHPHQEILDELEKYGIKILRTDRDGDIKIISDGLNYIIK
ncbi:MBL fold metallo-hydrolase [bacterium]|nr:MBL fold metallo-hydrolase [bacterium]